MSDQYKEVHNISITSSRQLTSEERGLVIATPTIVKNNNIYFLSPELDPSELRFELIFWDILDFPSNNRISAGIKGEAVEAVKAGILVRSRVTHSEITDPGFAVMVSHSAAFLALDRMQPGRWSLGCGTNSIPIPEEYVSDERGLIFRLAEAIPVPAETVPLNEVLEFREKRRPEHLRLRSHLEEVYQKVRSSPDAPLAELSALNNLDKAIKDQIAISRERKFPLRLASFDAKLTGGDIVAAVGGLVGATSFHLPLTAAALAGVAGAAFAKVFPGVRLREKRDAKTPFEYAVQIDKYFL